MKIFAYHQIFFRLVSLGLGAVFVVACKVVPPANALGEALSKLEAEVPESWSAGATGAAGVDCHWVERFGDAGLVAAVAEALASNPDLQGALARLEIARENARLAGVPLNPTMNSSLNGSRRKQNFIGFPIERPAAGNDAGDDGGGAFTNTSNTFGVSLDVSWEIDLWGRLRAAASAAVGEVQAAGAELRGAYASLAAQVAKAWFALAEARMQLALAEETVVSYRETEQVIRDRFKTGGDDGGASGAQLRLALSDIAVAKASVAAQKEIVARVQRQLEALLGRYPKGALQGAASLPDSPAFPPSGLPSELLTRRPDVQAAERRFAAQKQRIREAKLAAFPSFSLTGKLGTSTEDLSDILDSDFGVWSLAGGLVQPVLTGGQLRAEKAKRKAERKQALAGLQATVLKAFSEVETALAVDRRLAERSEALAEAVTLASEAAGEARTDYRTGVGDILTILTAQNRALRAKSEHLSALRARLENRIDLHLALGGDYQPIPQKKATSGS